jgi:hypothetical protein
VVAAAAVELLVAAVVMMMVGGGGGYRIRIRRVCRIRRGKVVMYRIREGRRRSVEGEGWEGGKEGRGGGGG